MTDVEAFQHRTGDEPRSCREYVPTYVINKVADTIETKTGIETDMLLSVGMHAAIERYVAAAFVKMGFDPVNGVDGLDKMSAVSVVDLATAYVQQMNPDAVARFRVERVVETVKKKVGQI